MSVHNKQATSSSSHSNNQNNSPGSKKPPPSSSANSPDERVPKRRTPRTRQRQLVSPQISSTNKRAEGNNPFLISDNRTCNFPPLDDFFQSRPLAVRRDEVSEHHDDEDGVSNVNQDNSIVSTGGCSYVSNANLSIGARSSLNEHLRHVAKYGLDESDCMSQQNQSQSQRNVEDRVVSSQFARPDPLDVAWDKLLEGGSDLCYPSSSSNSNANESLNIHDVSHISHSPSITHATVSEQQSHFVQIIPSQSNDDEAIEVMTDLSASDYFNSSRVQQLRTPPRNADRRFPSVTLGRGEDADSSGSQENSLLRERFHVDDDFESSDRQFAYAGKLFGASDFSENAEKNTLQSKITVASTATIADADTGMAFRNLDLSHISADGSDVHDASFGINDKSYTLAIDENDNHDDNNMILSSLSFNALSPARKADETEEIANSGTRGDATSLFRAVDASSSVSSIRKSDSIRSPYERKMSAIQEVASGRVLTPLVHRGGDDSTSTLELSVEQGHFPPPISGLKASPPIQNFLGTRTSTAIKNEDDSTASDSLKSRPDDLSPISKQAAESASDFLRQYIREPLQESRASSQSYQLSSHRFKQKLRRTNAVPLLDPETEHGSNFDSLDKSAQAHEIESIEARLVSVSHPDGSVLSPDVLNSTNNTSYAEKESESSSDCKKTPESSFARDSGNGSISLSPITVQAGLHDSSDHFIGNVYWGTNSVNSSMNQKTHIYKTEQHGSYSSHDDRVTNDPKYSNQTLLPTLNLESNQLPPFSLEYKKSIQVEADDGISPLHSSSSNKNSLQSKSMSYHSTSFSSVSHYNNRSHNTTRSDALHNHDSYEANLNSASFDRHTFPKKTKSAMCDSSVHSSPAAVSWGLTDRRRYRTVVPLRVFMAHTEEFFPAQHDSFSFATESAPAAIDVIENEQ